MLFFTSIIIFIITSTIVAKIFLFFTNLIHKPHEGVFNRNKKDKDYCYWCLRSIIKKWPTWLARQLKLPILETIILKILGIKTKFSNSLEGWIDCEFIELGRNIKLGQGALIMSNLVVHNKLIIRKVIIKDNVIIGAHSVILPGTIIENNTIVGVISMTTVNQHLEGNSIYHGVPAKKLENEISIIDKVSLETLLFQKEDLERFNKDELSANIKELSVPFHFYIMTGWIIIGCSFIIPGFLFILFIFGILIPNVLSIPLTIDNLSNGYILSILLLTPIILIAIYLLHLFFVALFTRWFYKLADKRGPSQGVFDRKLDESSTMLDYYHFRSFLHKYPIFIFIRSPFPWLINLDLKFISSNKIGKGTIFEETFFHSHINFGKDCYIGTFTHISNHVVDGVYGEENLTFFGADLGDNSVFSASNGALPGLEMGNNSTVLPMSATIKYDKLGNNNIYFGFPSKKLSKEEIIRFLGGDYYRE